MIRKSDKKLKDRTKEDKIAKNCSALAFETTNEDFIILAERAGIFLMSF